MRREDYRYVTPGKKFKSVVTGDIYYAKGYVDEKGTVLASTSPEGGNEVVIDITAFEPADMVRFVTPESKTLFWLSSLGSITIDGEEHRVEYYKPNHFVIDGKIYHMGEFAEETQDKHVAPVVPKGELSAEDIDNMFTLLKDPETGKIAPRWCDRTFFSVSELGAQSIGQHIAWGGKLSFIGLKKDKQRYYLDYHELIRGVRRYEIIHKLHLFDDEEGFIVRSGFLFGRGDIVAEQILQYALFNEIRY